MVKNGGSEPPQEGGSFVEGRLLDGFLLLAAGGSSSPDDVVVANLSSLQIVDVAAEDLAFFHNLHKLDASDNQLGYDLVLQHMARSGECHIGTLGRRFRLPRLSTLSLACNSISSLQVPPVGVLKKLESLDLSFNELHGDVLATLAVLPSLVTLNLSSNCISSVPPEQDLYGLQSLEELSLDANDLVQFVQWRALDAIPRLRKLSLSSNRVKRLKDDTPEVPGGDTSYFQTLQDLDLSGNEIASVDNLPVVRFFRALKHLNLSDNPCTKEEAKAALNGIQMLKQERKPWYLKGNGSHQRREKAPEPKLKLNRKKMRRVHSSPHELPGTGLQAYKGSMMQVGVLDHEANQLLVSLGSRSPSPTDEPLSRYLEDGDDGSGSFFVTDAGAASGGRPQHHAHHRSGVANLSSLSRGVSASALDTAIGASGLGAGLGLLGPGPELLSDDITEQELDEIFRQQRARIAQKFAEQVEEPASFMRPRPFQVSAAAGQRLGMASRPAVDEDDRSGGASPSSVKRTSSTSRGDIAEEESFRHLPVTARWSLIAQQHQQQSQVVPLPPIRSSGGQDSRSSSAASLPPALGPGILSGYVEKPPGRAKPPAEFGAMEAFKAIRAMQKAEFVF